MIAAANEKCPLCGLPLGNEKIVHNRCADAENAFDQMSRIDTNDSLRFRDEHVTSLDADLCDDWRTDDSDDLRPF